MKKLIAGAAVVMSFGIAGLVTGANLSDDSLLAGLTKGGDPGYVDPSHQAGLTKGGDPGYVDPSQQAGLSNGSDAG